ncbi:unnamed protein product [Phyllotreta striolata]|uniref:Uncharacterized protein n=1 Tax=Phyllotreta striolata TaxID=444603 RepID=A0A9N9XPH3_PHYSR|nr:unnamed protein product [Phyllotreta striolata]
MELLSSQELEKCMDKFEFVLSKQTTISSNHKQFLQFAGKIIKDLKNSKKTENALRKNLKVLTAHKNFNLHSKYVDLTEKHEELEIEYNQMLKDKEEMNNKIQIELETQKAEYLKKINELEEKSQKEITSLKNQLENIRNNYEKKEKELFNELQMTQAASALEWDERETNLKQKLEESKIQQRQLQNNLCELRYENNQLRSQISSQQFMNQRNVLYYQENCYQPNFSNYNGGNKLSENQYPMPQAQPEKIELIELENQSVTDIRTSIGKNITINSALFNTNGNNANKETSQFKFLQPDVKLTKPTVQVNSNTTNGVEALKNTENKPLGKSVGNKREMSQVNCIPRSESFTGIYNNKCSNSQQNVQTAPSCSKNTWKESNAFTALENRKNVNKVLPLVPQHNVNNKKNNSAKNTETRRKKRKLFDPKSTDYLD